MARPAAAAHAREVASNLLDALEQVSTTVLYLAAFLLALGESAVLLTIVMPGEVGLVLAGAIGNRQAASLPVLIALGAAGALAGDTLSWHVGRRWGTSICNRWGWSRRLLAPALETAQEVLHRRGGIAIFGARWVGALRALVPMVAGSAGIPYRRLVLWDLPAAVAWSSVVVCVGWYLGEPATRFFDRSGQVVTALAVLVVALWLLVVWRRRSSRGDATDEVPAPTPASEEPLLACGPSVRP